MMEFHPLDRISQGASRMCFGCEQLGGTDWGEVDVGTASLAVQKALDFGINFFDTADVYGLGLSEERLAQALGDARHSVTIATKGGVRWAKAHGRALVRTDCSPDYIRSAVFASLRRLRLERIPLYYLHRFDAGTPLEDTLNALMGLMDAGLIGAVGYSNFPLAALKRAHAKLPAAAVQIPYSLLDRHFDDVREYCAVQSIPVVAYGPLAQGVLTGKYDENSTFPVSDRRHRLPLFSREAMLSNASLLEELRVVADARDVEAASVAIRWCLEQSGISFVLTGVKTPEQVAANCAAFGWNLTPSEVELLSRISALSACLQPGLPNRTTEASR